MAAATGKIFLALSGVMLIFAARAGGVSFSDSTFNLADYSETSVFTSSGSDSVSWMQCPTCGNPGSALQIQMTLPTALDVGAVGFINNNFAYIPSSQGVISTIDASVDKNIITNIPVDSSTTFTNTFRPLIEQDGVIFLAAIPGPTFNGGTTGYNTISQTGLGASDFTQYDFATNTFGSGHPNFAGDPMLFGLGQITSFGVSSVNFEADYDNLNLSINAVPEPQTATLILIGFGAGALLLSKTRSRDFS